MNECNIVASVIAD